MKETKDTRPFAEILDDLLTAETMPIELLYSLSDLAKSQLKLFRGKWAGTAADRKIAVARHLADICEEDFTVDFSSIFAYCVRDDEPLVRMAALDGLWDSEDPALVAPMMKIVADDPDEHVRQLAAATLGHFITYSQWQMIPAGAAEDIVPRLIAQYDREESYQVRRALLETLGSATDSEVETRIRAAYQDGNDEFKRSAVFAMGQNADTIWKQIVLSEMDSPDEEMRFEAARAAGSVGGSDAVQRLMELAEEDAEQVAISALQSLGEIGGDEAVGFLQRFAEQSQAEELVNMAEEALESAAWLGDDADFALLDLGSAEDESTDLTEDDGH